jgi:hypothetical protein
MHHGRLIITLAALATAVLTLAPGAAAQGSSIQIDPLSQVTTVFFFNGHVTVGYRYECSGGTGTVFGTVTQSPPESAFTTSAFGFQNVACDGKRHDGSVTMCCGFGFDAGRATATLTLSAPSGSATDTRVVKLEPR